MTIIALTQIQMNRMLEANVNANTTASNGEFIFTTDSARLLIGTDPTQGNQNFGRTDVFPYKNQEVLTESSLKNQELFSIFVRNQDDQDFFPPALIPNAVGFTNVLVPPYDGGFAQKILFAGDYNSALIEYHAYVPGYYNSFYLGLGNITLTPPEPTLIQSGFLRVLTDANGALISNSSNNTTISSFASSNTLEFGVNSTVNGYVLQAQNNYSAPIMLRLRTTIISVGNAVA